VSRVTVAIHGGSVIDLETDKDYLFTWQLYGQRLLRTSRMQFLGLGGPGGDELQFNGRGPNRETDRQYCGTTSFPPKTIRNIREVLTDPSARFAERKD
jgi:hypothetical protein